MVARFSEKFGYIQPRTVIQTDDLDEQARRQLWDVVYLLPGKKLQNPRTGRLGDSIMTMRLWFFLEQSAESLQRTPESTVLAMMRDNIFNGELYEVMDLLQFFATPDENIPFGQDAYIEAVNNTFERNLVGYRVLGNGDIIQVTSPQEVDSIESALGETAGFPGVQMHLKNALAMLSDRKNPNYAKAVHEAISAVEGVARHYTGEKTLGAALKKLKDNGVPVHSALEKGWDRLYGYTSDGAGVRHGHVDPAEVDEALATYFVVTCSAFVGYLLKVAQSPEGKSTT